MNQRYRNETHGGYHGDKMSDRDERYARDAAGSREWDQRDLGTRGGEYASFGSYGDRGFGQGAGGREFRETEYGGDTSAGHAGNRAYGEAGSGYGRDAGMRYGGQQYGGEEFGWATQSYGRGEYTGSPGGDNRFVAEGYGGPGGYRPEGAQNPRTFAGGARGDFNRQSQSYGGGSGQYASGQAFGSGQPYGSGQQYGGQQYGGGQPYGGSRGFGGREQYAGEHDFGSQRYGGGQYRPSDYGSQYEGMGREAGAGQYGGQFRGGQYDAGAGQYGGGSGSQYGAYGEPGMGGRSDMGRGAQYGGQPPGGQYGGQGFGMGGRDAGTFGSPRTGQYGAGMERTQAGRSARGLGPKGYRRSDERLQEDICERLTDDWRIDASDVSVRVADGVVTLEGSVPERRVKHRIEDMIEACNGVTEIRNNLSVSSRPYGSSYGATSSDDTSTTASRTQASSSQSRSGTSTGPGASATSASGTTGSSGTTTSSRSTGSTGSSASTDGKH